MLAGKRSIDVLPVRFFLRHDDIQAMFRLFRVGLGDTSVYDQSPGEGDADEVEILRRLVVAEAQHHGRGGGMVAAGGGATSSPSDEFPSWAGGLFHHDRQDVDGEDHLPTGQEDLPTPSGSGSFTSTGASFDKARALLRTASAMTKAALRRALQDVNSPGQGSQDESAAPTTDDGYTLHQALEVRRRLQIFSTFMGFLKLIIGLGTLFFAFRALRSWTDYELSSRHLAKALLFRIVLALGVTCLPWYAVFFSWDDEKRPGYMQFVARLYLDALMTLPVAALTFMVTPGFVAGSVLTMSLFPYAIVPYVVLFVAPVGQFRNFLFSAVMVIAG